MLLFSLLITGAVGQQLCPLGFGSGFQQLPATSRLRGFTPTDANFSAPHGVGCAFSEVASNSATSCESVCAASATCQGYEYVGAALECKR